jgi:hypothetical protein
MWEGNYPDKLKKLILLFDKRINKIENFEWILGKNYSEENLQKIKDLIKNKRIEKLIQIKDDSEVIVDADLTVVKFKDQIGSSYLAIIYDSWELWDDPRILEIYPA